MIELAWLPEPERHPLYPEIVRLLEPAAKLGGVPVREPGDLVWLIYAGPVLLAAVTTLLWDDGVAEVRLAGGARHRDWATALDETMTRWARASGAKRLTMRGRKGWDRYARQHKWNAAGKDRRGHTIYEKELG